VIRTLAYCAFLPAPGISVPPSGVNGAALQVTDLGRLRVLWSEVEWPFGSAALQRNAVEFHSVVTGMFLQTAVIPFRLLSIFEDQSSFLDFITEHQADFIADLERLRNLVQMECVLYFGREGAVSPSGKAYLELKATLARSAEAYVQSIGNALAGLNHGIRTRESKSGNRIFVLVERGREAEFHSIVRDIAVPERLARRTSGPWPPAEFLSETVKMPQSAGPK
jgi:hypothetical protein